MSAAQEIEDLPQGGLVYEPRSLWSTRAVTMSDVAQELVFPRQHFYNGGKYPITLDRVAVHGINYDLAVSAAGGFPWASSGAVQNGVSLKVSVPQRYHYSRAPILINGGHPEPTGSPRTYGTVYGTPYFPASTWGLSILDMRKRPLMLQRGGAIELGFGSIVRPAREAGLQPRGYAVWQQEGGLFAGAARSFRWDVLARQPTAGQLANPVQTQTQEGWPYPPTPYQIGYAPIGQTVQYWDSTAHFTSKDFLDQDPTRNGSSRLTQLRVMLDQRQVDEAVSEALGVLPVPPQMESLAGRIGTRVRVTAGGSGDWWWRPGAPLSLVADTLTPATVYKLRDKITLSPNDGFDVQALIPAIPNLPQGEPERTMVIGISFNGYAAIEG